MRQLLQRFSKQLPPGELVFDRQVLESHSGDKWFASQMPDAVALPHSTASVSAILKFASRHGLPVTPWGAGHGYAGGCVPLQGGILLSLERMNRIKEIHPRDFIAVVEPGVLTQTLQESVEKRGLYYPPDPASRANSSIGGNIATNAGGPRCLKYGVTRDYVIGLEVVLANGTVVQLGSRTHKNKTGFELARLFVGSEGLLGVITEATLKLIPLPRFRASLSVGFDRMKTAIEAIHKIFQAGFLPCAVELADEFTIEAAVRRTGSRLLEGCRAHLIIEIDGQEKSVRSELRLIEKLLPPTRFINRAWGSEACERIWGLRREFSYALRDTGLMKLNEDVAVPRSKLQDLFNLARRIQENHRFPVACFGHAGDGNIHVNIMVDPSSPGSEKRQQAALDELFQGVLNLGGVITGEHGIGLAKKPWWPLAVPKEARRLHQTIKSALDPAGLLNPGKFL
jgi:glycolate oxidase